MIIRTLKFAHKTIILATEIIGGVSFLSLSLIFLILWKFSQGPVDVTFAADYVQKALVQGDEKTTVAFDQIVAEWPRFDGPISLGLRGFKVFEEGKTALEIQSVGLRIAKAPLLIGLFKPEAIILNQPSVQIIRETDGDFRFLVGGNNAGPRPETPQKSSPIKEVGSAFFLGGTLPDSPLAIFSRLERFEVRDALLVTEDHISKATWVVPKVNATLDRKANAFDVVLQYQMAGAWQKSKIELQVKRDKKKRDMRFKGRMDHVDLALFSSNFFTLRALDGQKFIFNTQLSGDLAPDMSLVRLNTLMTSEQGELNLSPTQGAPLSFSDLSANISYDRDSGKLSVHDTSLLVNDIRIELSAEHDLKKDEKSLVPVQVRIPQLSFSEIKALWPTQYKDLPAAEWLTEKLSEGTIKDLKVFLDVDPKNPLAITTEQIRASFDFENLKADYRAPLIPASAAKGHAIIEDDALTISVEHGKLADLDVRKASVSVTNLTRPTPGVVNVDVDLDGPLRTIFDYIGREPINLQNIIAGENASIRGQVEANVHITFPAIHDLPADAVKVTVDSRMNDIRLPKIVRGLDLTGGPYTLKVADGSFTLKGKGFLDDRPIDLVYSEYLNPVGTPFVSDIKASVVADQKLRDHFGIHLDQFIEGSLPVDLHYKEPQKGNISIDVRADLTPVRFRVRPFGYDKPQGVSGEASCVAVVSGRDIQEVKNLTLTVGKDVSGSGTLKFGQVGNSQDVKSGTFRVENLGSDNNFTLLFEQTSPNSFTFDINGKSLDARSFLSAREETPVLSSKPSPAIKINAKADHIRTGKRENQFVRQAKIFARVDSDGEIHALDLQAIAGKSRMSVTIKPDSKNTMQLDLTADDAGETLYAFDVYDNIIGGTLKIRGEQILGAGVNDLKGRAVISNFSVVKAPALAQLINAFSISGLAELLQNKGIAFSKLKADFIWKKKPEGRVISLINGRTSGASVGLSFGGLVNQTKGTMDISGTIVPMSGINGIVNKIPLIGTLLTGGSNGGLIAATYAVKGPSDNPSVMINPLSVLTPGFLRSILFEGGIDMNPYDDFDEPEEPKKKSPVPMNE